MPLWLLITLAVLAYVAAASLLGRRLRHQQPPTTDSPTSPEEGTR